MTDSTSVSSGLAALNAGGWDVSKPPSKWSGVNTPIILAQSAIPVGICPGNNVNTVSAAGAYTSPTALPTVYAGIWLYFPANAINGDATGGFYWCTCSSTTAVQVTNAAPIPGTNFGRMPFIPTYSGNLSVGGAGAAFQSSATEITLASVTVPGGAMGTNGTLRSSLLWSRFASTNSNTLAMRCGGTSVRSSALNTATQQSQQMHHLWRNRGGANSQVQPNFGANSNFDSVFNSVPTITSVNTAIDQPLTFTGTLTAATADFIVLESMLVEVLPG